VLHHQSLHWKVAGVAGRKASPRAEGGGGDKAVGLTEDDASSGKLAPPSARLFALGPPERSNAQPVEQVCHAGFLGRLDSPKQLFHVDGTDVGTVTGGSQLGNPDRGRAPPQGIDEGRGVEKDPAQFELSADSATVSAPLRPDPGGGIAVPFVAPVLQRAQRNLDLVPPPLILKRLPDGGCDEGAAATAPNACIEVRNQFVLEAYVQSHGHSLAHTGDQL